MGTTVTGFVINTTEAQGSGSTGHYTVNNSQTVASETMHAAGILPGLATNLTVSGVTGTIVNGMVITDSTTLGISGPPLRATGGMSAGGDVSIVPTYYAPNSYIAAPMTGTVSTLRPRPVCPQFVNHDPGQDCRLRDRRRACLYLKRGYRRDLHPVQ